MRFLIDFFLGPEKEAVWGELADQLGGRLETPSGWGAGVRVVVKRRDWILTLDQCTESGRDYTRLRAPFLNRDGFRFHITREGASVRAVKTLPPDDLEVGEAAFDRLFVVRGNQPEKLKALLANTKLRELIQAHPDGCFSIQDEAAEPDLPEGVDVLLMQLDGPARDPERFRGFYDIFTETLLTLSRLDAEGKDDLQALREALAAPGGRVLEAGATLWNGDKARVRAARRLGHRKDAVSVPVLIGMLREPNSAIREAAIEALGRIGAPEAGGAVLPFLCYPVPDWRTPVREAAALALQRMRFDRECAAMLAVLAGREHRLPVLDGPFRSPAVAAFCWALEGDAYGEITAAARALQQWGAAEGLLPLKLAKKRFRSDPKAPLAALDEAIAALEAHASLPRPSLAPIAELQELPIPTQEPARDAADFTD